MSDSLSATMAKRHPPCRCPRTSQWEKGSERKAGAGGLHEGPVGNTGLGWISRLSLRSQLSLQHDPGYEVPPEGDGRLRAHLTRGPLVVPATCSQSLPTQGTVLTWREASTAGSAQGTPQRMLGPPSESGRPAHRCTSSSPTPRGVQALFMAALAPAEFYWPRSRLGLPGGSGYLRRRTCPRRGAPSSRAGSWRRHT